MAAATFFVHAIAVAQTADSPIVGLDVSGGYAARSIPGKGSRTSMDGWHADAALRVKPWLGFKGDVTRTSHPDASQTMFVGGVVVQSPYLLPQNPGRFFAHAMVGAAGGSLRGEDVPYRPAIVMGGGMDVLLFVRLQVDYVRSDFGAGESPHGVRAMAGGVVPLCWRDCQKGDGFDLSPERKRN
jgi:hypothetical protein